MKNMHARMEVDDDALRLGRGEPALKYESGVGAGWVPRGPPHMRRFLAFTDKDTGKEQKQQGRDTMGPWLAGVNAELMCHPAFAAYLQLLTAVTPVSRRSSVRRFRPGLDYTVAHRSLAAKKKYLDACLCFVNIRDGEEAAEGGGNETQAPGDAMDDAYLWESGDAGGFECYIEQDEEAADAAEVYASEKTDGGDDDDDDGGVLLSVTPGTNVLSLVMRDEDTLRFVKYVSARAPSSRWDISTDFELSPDDDGEEEEEDDEDEDENEDGEGEGDDDDDDDEVQGPAFVMRR